MKMMMDSDGFFVWPEGPMLCSGGITEAIAGIVASVSAGFGTAGGAIATGLGLGDVAGAGAAIGSGLEGATVGAGLGAAEGAVTGGNIGTDALTGGITGGAIEGLGGAIGGATGLGATAGDAIAGAGAGAVGQAVTGGNPLTGALEGGVAGTATGLLGGGTDAGPTFSDSLTPATGGPAISGPIDSGTWDAAPASAGGAVTSTSPQVTLANLGGAPATGGVGPAASAFTPPASVGPGGVDPTASIALGTDISTAPGASFSTPGTTDPGLIDTPPAPPYGGDVNPATGQVNPVTAPSQSLLSTLGGDISSGWNSVTNAINSPTGKTLGVGLTGLGLAKDLLAPSNIKGLSGLESEAAAQASEGQQLINSGIAGNAAPSTAAANLATLAATQGNTLENYLPSGTLPPGVQTAIDQALSSQVATIKGQYASRGMAGSSAEAADIAAAQNASVANGATIATNLLNSGVTLDQLSSQVYSSLIGQGNNLISTGASLSGTSGSTLSGVIQANVAQNNAVNSAISGLAAALAGGTKITLNGTTTPATVTS